MPFRFIVYISRRIRIPFIHIIVHTRSPANRKSLNTETLWLCFWTRRVMNAKLVALLREVEAVLHPPRVQAAAAVSQRRRRVREKSMYTEACGCGGRAGRGRMVCDGLESGCIIAACGTASAGRAWARS